MQAVRVDTDYYNYVTLVVVCIVSPGFRSNRCLISNVNIQFIYFKYDFVRGTTYSVRWKRIDIQFCVKLKGGCEGCRYLHA